MIAAASPGTLIKIAEMRPPYSQPKYTAASKINALSGGKPIANANGNKMATPLIGPNPGNMPTIVPINAPIKAINKFSGNIAT